MSKSHRSALTAIEYGITTDAQIAVLAGDIGCGKTTVLRYMISQLPPDIRAVLIAHTPQTFGELLSWIASDLGIAFEGRDGVAVFQDIVKVLAKGHAAGRRTILIIDEAQSLSFRALEGVRMLSNVNLEQHPALQLVLVGQPDLLEKLRAPNLVQLAQRVSIDCFLGPLNRDETRDYIWHRLRTVGASEEIFDAESCDIVHAHSRGIPRLVNTLCDLSLVYAFAEQRPTVTPDIVWAVVRDRQAVGVIPISDRNTAESRLRSAT
ncbi:MAG TPA: AAA family ATPase [Alphaproteobacteria bacterium]|nr:AAA family ATPase [Alphaproteobacteria bacterium]